MDTLKLKIKILDQKLLDGKLIVLYRKQKKNKLLIMPVEFIAYPGPGHFPGDPVRSLDVYTRWLGWFQKYIGKNRP